MADTRRYFSIEISTFLHYVEVLMDDILSKWPLLMYEVNVAKNFAFLYFYIYAFCGLTNRLIIYRMDADG